ncbi:MAG: isocitrate/isopropylmalate family dehydrogenase [Acidobacteriota bacterium]
MTAPLVTLIKGDGIGPEVVEATVEVVAAAGGAVTWEEAFAGARAVEEIGEPLPPATLDAIGRSGVALKGPLSTPVAGGYRSVNVAIRRAFDFYANVRPARSFPGVPSRYENVDIVLVRENTEGMYAGLEEHVSADGEVARTLSQVTRRGSERVATFAFNYARRNGRKKVTIVHKANILKMTSGLFLETARVVARRFPEIECTELIVDNAAMQLVKDPARWDVIVTTNLFGDILSDLCAGLVGGLGVAPAANIGERGAMFEAVHGTAPDIAGKGLANPAATMLAAAMMLAHMDQPGPAARIEAAVRSALADPATRTADIGGSASTRAFTDAVKRAVGSMVP